jgi:hypothetical protein
MGIMDNRTYKGYQRERRRFGGKEIGGSRLGTKNI